MGIVDLIKRDVRFENETKKGVVTVRIFYIIILLADILNLIFAGFPVLEAFPVRIMLIFLSIPMLFICTYFFRTAVFPVPARPVRKIFPPDSNAM